MSGTLLQIDGKEVEARGGMMIQQNDPKSYGWRMLWIPRHEWI
jgi:hypothetical protein